jgi:hypothetical protein
MTKLEQKKPKQMSRRTFVRSAVAAAAAIQFAGPSAEASRTKRTVKFYKNLAPGHIGVSANQRQALEYAVKYGFDSITPNLGEFENRSAAEIREWVAAMKEKGEWVAAMKEKGVRYGCGGLPVQFRRDQGQFEKDLSQLPKRAAVLKQMGVSRTATWITPGHRELTYLKQFDMLKKRFREVAKILKEKPLSLHLHSAWNDGAGRGNRHGQRRSSAGQLALVYLAWDTRGTAATIQQGHRPRPRQ